MDTVKLRLLLHLARKRRLALLREIAKGAFCVGGITLFVLATIYNASQDVNSNELGAHLAFGVFFIGLFILASISVALGWREDLEELTIPYAHQEWARPYDYFMHTLPKSIQPKLF